MRVGGAIRVDGGAGMSECVVRMEMPRVCITENGYYGYCPMDRVWCIQRNAPPDITMREAYEAMTDKIPSWCPILCQLPEGHGRLVDADACSSVLKKLENEAVNSTQKLCFGYAAKMFEEAYTIVPADTAERSET
jgi:hypothetical protein